MINRSVNPNESIRRRWYPLTWCCIKNRFEKWHPNSCEQDKKQPNSLMALIWHKFLKRSTNFQCFDQNHESPILAPILANHQKHNIPNELLFTFKTKLQVCTSFLDFWSFATYTTHREHDWKKYPPLCYFACCVVGFEKNICKYIWQKRGILF